MLTKDKILETAALEGLTADQITALEKLSKNDEQTVIDENRSSWWKQIDDDIKEVHGLDKPSGIKTYKHLKEVLTDSKTKAESAEGLKTKITEKDDKIKLLNDQVKAGAGDEALKTQITSLESERSTLKQEVLDVKASYKTQEEEYNTALKETSNRLMNNDLTTRFSTAIANPDNKIKFLDTIPEPIRKREIAAAQDRVMKRGAAFYEDDGSGNKTLIFKNEDGTVLKNKSKGLDAYTPEDMFLEELNASGLLAKQKKAEGAGTFKKKQEAGSDFFLDTSTVKSQSEAIDLIRKGVMENGISKASPDFMKEVQRIAKENEIFSLPE